MLLLRSFISLTFSFCMCVASGLREERRLHVDCGGIESGPSGQRHPVVSVIHCGRHHLRAGRERGSRLPLQPQSNSLWRRSSCWYHAHYIRCSGSRPLYSTDCQVWRVFIFIIVLTRNGHPLIPRNSWSLDSFWSLVGDKQTKKKVMVKFSERKTVYNCDTVMETLNLSYDM